MKAPHITMRFFIFSCIFYSMFFSFVVAAPTTSNKTAIATNPSHTINDNKISPQVKTLDLVRETEKLTNHIEDIPVTNKPNTKTSGKNTTANTLRSPTSNIKQNDHFNNRKPSHAPGNIVTPLDFKNEKKIEPYNKRLKNKHTPTLPTNSAKQFNSDKQKSQYAIPIGQPQKKPGSYTGRRGSGTPPSPTIPTGRAGFVPFANSTTTKVQVTELMGTGMRLLLSDSVVTPTAPPVNPGTTVITVSELIGTGMRLLLSDPVVTPTTPPSSPGTTAITVSELIGTGMRLLLADPVITPTTPPVNPGTTIVTINELMGTGVKLLIRESPTTINISNQFTRKK